MNTQTQPLTFPDTLLRSSRMPRDSKHSFSVHISEKRGYQVIDPLSKHETEEETHLYSWLGETGVLLNGPCHWNPQRLTGHELFPFIYHVPVLSPSLTPVPKRGGASLNLSSVFYEIPLVSFSLLGIEQAFTSQPKPWANHSGKLL